MTDSLLGYLTLFPGCERECLSHSLWVFISDVSRPEQAKYLPAQPGRLGESEGKGEDDEDEGKMETASR